MDENLAYDLRQKYAEIVGVHLETVTRCRMALDYPGYFKALENLHTVVAHKFKTKREKKKGEEEQFTDDERYKQLRSKAIEVANKFPMAYLGKTQNPNEVAEIEGSFRKIERFLFRVMDGSKMFGSNWDGGGL